MGLLHKETMAQSRDLYGPYEPNSSNPILSNANTTEYCRFSLIHMLWLIIFAVQAVGHTDLFQDARGQGGAALAVRSGPE